MLLGTLMSRLENERCATEMMEVLGDLVLYADTAAAAQRLGETPGEFLAASVGAYAAAAGDEEWLALIAAIERAEDPGRAAIQRILRWAIAYEPAEAKPSAGVCSCAT